MASYLCPHISRWNKKGKHLNCKTIKSCPCRSLWPTMQVLLMLITYNDNNSSIFSLRAQRCALDMSVYRYHIFLLFFFSFGSPPLPAVTSLILHTRRFVYLIFSSTPVSSGNNFVCVLIRGYWTTFQSSLIWPSVVRQGLGVKDFTVLLPHLMQ